MSRHILVSLVVLASTTFVVATPPPAEAAEASIPSLWVVDDVVKKTYNVTLNGGLNTSFGTPNTAISSITVDPSDGTLWGVNEGSSTNPGKLVNYSRTGVVLGQIPSSTFGAFGGEGLAVAVGSGGDSLWVVDDPDTGGLVPKVYNVQRDGTLISSFPTSSFSASAVSPQAIAYDAYSDSLWITDNAAEAVFNISTAGVLLGSFPTDAGPFVTPVTNVQGITVESATHLWITGRTTGMLYRVTKTGTTVSHSFPASVFDPAASNPTGVAFDTSTPAGSHREALAAIRDHLDAASAGDAVKELDKALGDDKHWDPDGSLNSAEGKAVFDKMKRAVEKLLAINSPPAAVTTVIDALVDLARDMAQAHIDEAVAAGADASLIAEANDKMASALAKIAAGDFDQAIDEYKNAWKKAREALEALDRLPAGSLWVVDDVVKKTYNVTLNGGLNTSFGTPNTAISSITVDPSDGTLWGVNEGSSTNPGKLVNYSRTGVVLGEIPSSTFGAFGGEGLAVAVGDGSLWVVDDPDTGGLMPNVYNVQRDGTLISSFPTSSFSAVSPQAIAYDAYSDSLWITDNAAEAVFNISTAGVLLGSFPTDAGPFVTPVTNVQGITVESATHLWITSRDTGMLYRVTKTGTRVSHSFPASVFDPTASNPAGVAFDTSTPAPGPLAGHRLALTVIRDDLDAARSGLGGGDAARAGDAVKELDKALGDEHWDPDGSLNSAEGKAVFDKMRRAVEKLLAINSPPAAVTTVIDALVDLARDMAQAHIDEAVAAGADASLIAEANDKMASALDKIATGDFDQAIDEYRKAWKIARDALLP